MKRLLQMIAALLALSALGCWLVTGAHRGWTQTSVPKKTVDEVTGIEAVVYQKHFIMGLDLLGGAWLGAAVLAGASLLFRKKTKIQ